MNSKMKKYCIPDEWAMVLVPSELKKSLKNPKETPAGSTSAKLSKAKQILKKIKSPR